MKGTKAAPITISGESPHDPTRLVITTGVVPYSMHLAFSTRMLEDRVARDALLGEAFRFDSGGRRIPGSLCVQAIVVLGKPQPEILVAHRPDRKESANPNMWSASFEEQFNPIYDAMAKKGPTEPDGTLEHTTRRGFEEEFIADHYDAEAPAFRGTYAASLHAVELELDRLNIGVIALISLPDTSFADISATWNALTFKEHNDIGHFPLTEESLRIAIRNEGPGHVREDLRFQRRCKRADFLEHPWDTTSKVRLALCLWLLEQGRL